MDPFSALTPEQLEALLNGPALAPPPGVIPRLVNPPSHRTATFATAIASLVVATLVIMMRLYTRVSVVRKISIADYSILIAWGCFVAFFGIWVVVGFWAPGIHQWDIRLKDVSTILYYAHVLTILYGPCCIFVKISILAQYIEIFLPTREPRKLYWSIIVLAVANFLYYVITTFLEIFACTPIAKAWDPLITDGHCINTLALFVASSAVNTASDLIILALPQTIIWRLNASSKDKITVSFVFLVAIIACVSSAFRLVYAVMLQNQDDVIYYTWLAGIWSLPELASGIMVACLPVARKFAYRMFETRMFMGIASSLGITLNNASKSKITNVNSNHLSGSHRVIVSTHSGWAGRSYNGTDRKYGISGPFRSIDEWELAGVPHA
ncbi:hypothetical protein F4861DRAFT_492070 [Xylaria intraflava]|nr:hypothetical protein F4861DRAFT_492070 [Xylaria intraflava]